MGRAPCCDKVGLKRGPWTYTEDMRLIIHIQKHGEGAWRTLPNKAGLLRCGKSCRLRWFNYLRPNIKKGNISKDEEILIIKLHSILGNRWSQIASKLPGRTDNEIKNHWNAHLKKRLYAMGIDPTTHKPLIKDDVDKVPNNVGCNGEIPMRHEEQHNLQCDEEILMLHEEQHNAQCNEEIPTLQEPNIIELQCSTVEETRSYGENHGACTSPHWRTGIVNKNCIDDLHTPVVSTSTEMIETPNVILLRSPCICRKNKEMQLEEWIKFPITQSLFPLERSNHMWSILENDFIWDQIDMIHDLKGGAIIISTSPSNPEDTTTQFDDLPLGNLWASYEHC